MREIYKVGMADLKVCRAPDGLTTLGLGSCVGVAVRDPVTKVGGLLHVMLPDSRHIKNNLNKCKFADTGIDELVRQVVALGAAPERLVAKVAGGAQMFNVQGAPDLVRIGDQNVEACKKRLRELKIPVLSSDTGLNYGRTIVFNPENGELLVRAVGKPEKII